ncbi:MAG TPA: MFS transporter [candidate division Zixibacteria bacterium]|nr:MFS transporter [candidate division Zixibacteria bacterium]
MRTITRVQRIYYLSVSLFWLSIAITLPLMVLILQSRGVDLFQIGLLMGAYSLTIVILEVPTGGLADAIGRKRVAMLAYSIILIGGLVLLFSFSFAAFLLAFILSGVGRALASGSLDAWFVDTLLYLEPEIDIQPPLAKAGTITLISLGIGTLLGGLLPRALSSLPAEGTAVITPFTTTILVSGLVLAILLVVIGLFVDESQTHQDDGTWKQGFRQVPSIVGEAVGLSRRNPTIVLLLGATLASGLALASIESFWSPHFAILIGGSEGNSLFFGALMAGSFLFGAFGSMASIPLSRLFKQRYALLASVFQGFQGLSLIVLALQGTVGLSVAFFWLLYLGMGVVNSPQATLMNEEIPSERRSSMLSVQSLAGYAGSIAGSVLLGYLAKSSSIGTAWIVAGVILLVSLVLYLKVDIRRTRMQEIIHEPETAVP